MHIPAVYDVNLSIVSPELALGLVGVLVLILDLFLRDEEARWLVVPSIAGVVLSGVYAAGLWGQAATAFHGAVVLDPFSLGFDFLFLTVILLTLLLSLRLPQLGSGHFALLLWAGTGMMLLAAASSLMTLFLGVELLSISLYLLVALAPGNAAAGEAALKYFILGAFATGFLLLGIAFLYGSTGAVTLFGIQKALSGGALNLPHAFTFLKVGLALFLVGLGFKLALVPFQVWVPDVYQGAPTPITAFMSVGTKAAAFAALLRSLYGIVPPGGWIPALTVLAVATLLVGSLLILRQTNLKRLLAYSGIVNAGYLLVALVSFGLVPAAYYLAAYTFMNLGAFAGIAALSKDAEEGAELPAYRGLAYRRPWLGASLAFLFLSLASIPPTGGFTGKFLILLSAVASNHAYLAVILVAATAISLFAYLRVVVALFTPAEEAAPAPRPLPAGAVVVVGIGVLGVLATGLLPHLFLTPISQMEHLFTISPVP